MKKHGGFIPGIRPGKKTSEFIDNILTRVTLPGSFFLAFVAVFPFILMQTMDVNYSLASFFGGTSLLIIVGVALDTLQQVESHLLMRHYDGFLKKGKYADGVGVKMVAIRSERELKKLAESSRIVAETTRFSRRKNK